MAAVKTGAGPFARRPAVSSSAANPLIDQHHWGKLVELSGCSTKPITVLTLQQLRGSMAWSRVPPQCTALPYKFVLLPQVLPRLHDRAGHNQPGPSAELLTRS